MKLLKDILYKVGLVAVNGDTHVMFNEIHFDSRKVAMDDVFVAISGTQVDGHRFIANAVNAGAKAIVCEVLPEVTVNGVTYLQVDDSQRALAIMAANFYGNPSKNLKLVGVTGTNGKTTVAPYCTTCSKKQVTKLG